MRARSWRTRPLPAPNRTAAARREDRGEQTRPSTLSPRPRVRRCRRLNGTASATSAEPRRAAGACGRQWGKRKIPAVVPMRTTAKEHSRCRNAHKCRRAHRQTAELPPLGELPDGSMTSRVVLATKMIHPTSETARRTSGPLRDNDGRPATSSGKVRNSGGGARPGRKSKRRSRGPVDGRAQPSRGGEGLPNT